MRSGVILSIAATHAAILSLLLLVSCGKSPSQSDSEGFGSVELSVRIRRPDPMAKQQATTWDSLVVEVSASDMEPIRLAYSIDPYDGIVSETFDNVPAGDDRTIKAWTVNAQGDTIHGVESTTVDIAPNQTVTVQFELDPIRGSIYIQLTGFPGDVDSLHASFVTAAGDTHSATVAKSTRVYMSLDNILYGSTGTLLVAGLTASGDTVGEPWREENYTFLDQNATLEASFVSVGKIAVEVTVGEPGGVTLVRGVMDTTKEFPDEGAGGDTLIISEIMYAANDSEFVEIHNPTGDSVFFDTLILQKENGTWRYFESIGIASQGFYVFGRRSLPWVDTYHSTQTALDLASTGGWITLRAKDSTVIDWVAYDAGSNDLEWPDVSGKKSIALDSLPANPEYNNYGRNWQEAVTPIDGSVTDQCGTPGISGN